MNTPNAPQDPPHMSGQVRVKLRVLETTDVHANLLPFDYYTNRPVDEYGLARTATLIHAARRECANCLLFDNGDFLQGTPISDLTARPGGEWTATHPAILAMNALEYDAATLGNHEFNFGLDWLMQVLAQASFPVTCANVLKGEAAALQQDEMLLPPYLLLPRIVTDTQGATHEITIGVIGFVPPQITIWDQFHLKGRIVSRDIVETARALVPQLREKGADLVIALAHTGIDARPAFPMMENAVLPLTSLPGIDAVLAGHSHQVFPAPEFGDLPGIQLHRGSVNGTPVVMAGARGSHLGVLDLDLLKSGDQWHVHSSQSEARPVAGHGVPTVEADPALTRLLRGAHDTTIRLTRHPLGHSPRPLHSYLALVSNSDALQLITRAKRAAVEKLLAHTPDEAYPVLAASAAYKTGGRGGPGYYTDIPPGELCLRHAADLYSFPNLLCALRLTGAELRDWLERAAIVFNMIEPGKTGQLLCNTAVPGHMFDVIDGLNYSIDLSQPALYDLRGRRIHDGPGRIRDLFHENTPVRDTDMYVLATNNFRAFGGGPFPTATTEQIIFAGTQAIQDLVADYIRTFGTPPQELTRTWQFCPMPGTEVVFETGPGLRQYPHDIAALRARDLGNSDAGFARFALPL